MTTTDPKLPPPVKPRTLLHARDFGYVTSDGRYRFIPQYRPRPLGGRCSKIDGWVVHDSTPGPDGKPRGSRAYGWPLAEVRDLYCTPGDRMPWLVCDMDDGVVRVAASRRAAVAWCSALTGMPVLGRAHAAGSTCYDYTFGSADDCVGFFVVRADHAHRHGFVADQQPLYPYVNQPWQRGPRQVAREADAPA